MSTGEVDGAVGTGEACEHVKMDALQVSRKEWQRLKSGMPMQSMCFYKLSKLQT